MKLALALFFLVLSLTQLILTNGSPVVDSDESALREVDNVENIADIIEETPDHQLVRRQIRRPQPAVRPSPIVQPKPMPQTVILTAQPVILPGQPGLGIRTQPPVRPTV
ncbi:hypothetical protein BKA69DRAFT_1039536 [Paraphysoderma sedebokerense]|nr:hypothetical protein BKA69DRAFT_1039536 [Paraphysoderma sedebokerense]